ncbi:hypothetical protein A3K69_04565 [Candidatus Bathyarchaeota archaeon RBG_16_57_9]|nr:MAG: hypothetical protein A3K69_04565 [Candidatus Bathyarchaeota archaeon RBG_16_57_9]
MPGTLDPGTIPKYVNQITGAPPVYTPEYVDPVTGAQYYTLDVTAFTQQVLPTTDALGNPTGFGVTSVWGYGGATSLGYIRNQPAASFEAQVGSPIYVRYQNKLAGDHLFPVDPTLHWADPNGMGMPMAPFTAYPPGYPDAQSPVPIIPHLHGGEVRSTSDGNPEAWFTSDGLNGYAYNTELTTWWDGTPIQSSETVFYYPNSQPATTLWYHDHALGITRINVMSGLAGFYLLRDPADTEAPSLPSGQYEVPIVLQDRTFNTPDPVTGQTDFWFPTVGLDPAVHPYWQPEFFGNVMMVNGLVWPNMNVEPGQYRLRLLDGSNARFYTLKLQDKVTGTKLPFIQIGSDGGYLKNAVALAELTIAPGERADVLVDFSGLPVGTKVTMFNSAKAPFPNGAHADPQTVGQIMQFTVVPATPTTFAPVITPANLPALNPDLSLAPGWPALATGTVQRPLVLWEVMGALGPTEILLNGQKWMAPVSEMPQYHTTEDWLLVNPTADTHPIHLHLVQFQLVSRQKIDMNKYVADWLAANQASGVMMPPWPNDWTVQTVDPLAVNAKGKPIYLIGKPTPAPANEQGWKDTVQVNPGEITILRVRFSPTDGSADYVFDPSVGPGYVWHCHILDHEDNEMMRPYTVLP